MRAIRYQAAGGIVVDKENRVLVLRRPSRNEVRLPKGHVEKGESHVETALREVVEESGYASLEVVADLGHQVVAFGYRGEQIVRDEYYFLLALRDGEQVEREAKELQFLPQWVSWEEALADLSYEAEREWVRRAHEAQGTGHN
jgi:8-oxo-dGTP pyrophosphatase MutT (NUDIX family)